MSAHANNTDTAAPKSFAALRHPAFRVYFVVSALGMMADNIEHVISYWMMFEKFHSPALAGFAVVSHWLPFLFFSVYSGALADRFDPRRIIQLGLFCFITASLGWGYLFITDTMEMWHAMVLLTLHGFAGVLWGPAGQLLVYDIVGAAQLQSAVRLSSTARMLGMLMGPAIGGGLMLAFGPPHGILVNALFYIPFMLWLFWAPFNRKHEENKRPAARGLADIVPTIREIAGNRTIVAMTLLAGGASLFIGNAYQAQMPGFAHDLGAGHADFTYSMLLAADAAGALVAGFVLESRGLLNARPRTAFILAMLWCCTIGGFAASNSYALAIGLLFFFRLSATVLCFNGANAGANGSADAHARARHRPLCHVKSGTARLRRRHRRPAGQPDRHPLVARAVGADAAHGGGDPDGFHGSYEINSGRYSSC